MIELGSDVGNTITKGQGTRCLYMHLGNLRSVFSIIHCNHRLEVPAKMAIKFSPHIGTLLGAGASHLNRIDDGVAELIDNSIQVWMAESWHAFICSTVLSCSRGWQIFTYCRE